MPNPHWNAVLFHGLAADRPATPDPTYGKDQMWISDDSGALYQAIVNAGSYAWQVLGGAAGALPTRATLWHDEATVLTGNAFNATLTLTSQVYSTETYQNTPADADSFTQSFVCDAGTYTLTALGHSDNNLATLDWYLDAVLVASAQDWYSAGSTFNVVKTVPSLVLTGGYHVLKGVVNGKNASSSNYYIALTKYWLKRVSD